MNSKRVAEIVEALNENIPNGVKLTLLNELEEWVAVTKQKLE